MLLLLLLPKSARRTISGLTCARAVTRADLVSEEGTNTEVDVGNVTRVAGGVGEPLMVLVRDAIELLGATVLDPAMLLGMRGVDDRVNV